MRTFAQKPKAPQQTAPARSANTGDLQESTTASRFGHFSRIPLRSPVVKAEGKPGGGAEKLVDGGTAPAAEDGGATGLDGGALQATPMGPPYPTPAPAPPVSPPQPPPPPPAWVAGKHVVPTFLVTESEGPRSNTDPATTNVDTPTFTGGAALDAAASMWRYQLSSVEGKGRINFVYYTADHYPAPAPNDDSGDLSNVTKANWKSVVKDLEDHKNGVAGSWSAYRRTILHERYHWATEWQGSVKTELVKAENDLEKEGVPQASSPDAAGAAKVLAPKAKKIFDDAMKEARRVYNALGDSPGDPPYVAGSVGATDLAARIKTHATAQKW